MGQDLFKKNKILKLKTICTICVAAWETGAELRLFISKATFPGCCAYIQNFLS